MHGKRKNSTLFLALVALLCLSFAFAVSGNDVADAIEVGNTYPTLQIEISESSEYFQATLDEMEIDSMENNGYFVARANSDGSSSLELINPECNYVISGASGSSYQMFITNTSPVNTTFYVTLKDYSYNAREWAGAISLKSEKAHMTVIFTIEGNNSVFGHNFGGITVEPTQDVEYILRSVAGGTLTLGASYTGDRVLALNGRVSVDADSYVSSIENGPIAYQEPSDAEIIDLLANYSSSTITFRFNQCCTTHSYSDWTTTSFPSCTETGSEERSCSYCGKKQTRVIEATGHVDCDWEVVSTPTCSTTGLKQKTCSECGNVFAQEEIPMLDHDYGYWHEEREATCTEEGLMQRECTECSHIETQSIPLTSHTVGDWEVVTPATCTEDGLKERKCSVCHQVVDSAIILHTGHVDGDWEVVTPATCTEDGLRQQRCAECNEVIRQEIITKLGHVNGDWEVQTPATCTTTGTKIQHCTVCHEIIAYGIIEKVDHTEGDWVVVTQATCTENGLKHLLCSECQAVLREETIDAVGHDWGEWTVTTEPTCTESGVETRFCNVCNAREDRQIEPLGHDFGEEWTIDRNATTTSTGEKSHHCSRCGERSEITEIPVLTPESSKEEIKNIVSEEVEEVIEEALEQIDQETLVEITDVASSALNDLQDLVSSGAISQEQYEQQVEIVQAVAETTIIVGAQMVESEQKGNELNEVIPESADIDMAGLYNDFYTKQINELLGKSSDQGERASNKRVTVVATVGFGGPLCEEQQPVQSQGIDFSYSAEDYRSVVDFVQQSVDNMANAVLLIRQCSGEKLVAQVKSYVTAISASSFRDFDKTAADNEFVENARTAIFLNMQQQVLATLQNQYDAQRSKSSSLAQNPFAEKQYQDQIDAVSDMEQFEIMVKEVLRTKYVALTGTEIDLESFSDIFETMFRNWALNQENDVDITLEELTTATINTTTKKALDVTFNGTLTESEISLIILCVVAFALFAVTGVAFSVLKKRGGKVING